MRAGRCPGGGGGGARGAGRAGGSRGGEPPGVGEGREARRHRVLLGMPELAGGAGGVLVDLGGWSGLIQVLVCLHLLAFAYWLYRVAFEPPPAEKPFSRTE